MRILKTKIARALLKHQNGQQQPVGINTAQQNHVDITRRILRIRVPLGPRPEILTPKGASSCKNVMKNYSRAFIIFALSPLALPYLIPLLQEHKVDLSSFQSFLKEQKKAANCIKGLRDRLLLVTNSDSDEVVKCKRMFQEMCVVFLKFFAANWIFHGKIMDKSAHLSYRLKLLRRVRNPATFTCLEDIQG